MPCGIEFGPPSQCRICDDITWTCSGCAGCWDCCDGEEVDVDFDEDGPTIKPIRDVM